MLCSLVDIGRLEIDLCYFLFLMFVTFLYKERLLFVAIYGIVFIKAINI